MTESFTVLNEKLHFLYSEATTSNYAHFQYSSGQWRTPTEHTLGQKQQFIRLARKKLKGLLLVS